MPIYLALAAAKGLYLALVVALFGQGSDEDNQEKGN